MNVIGIAAYAVLLIRDRRQGKKGAQLVGGLVVLGCFVVGLVANMLHW